MFKKILWGVFLMLSVFTYSQESIKIGSGTLNPNDRVTISSVRGVSQQSGETDYKVMRFEKLPNKAERISLKSQGIELLSYIQDNLYYVAIQNDISTFRNTKLTGVKAVYNVNPLWKISPKVASKNIPNHALITDKVAKLNVQYFATVNEEQVLQAIKNSGAKIINNQKEFNTFIISLNLDKLNVLASNPFIRWIEYVSPQATLENVQGRTLSRASILNTNRLGGRGLKGKGMIVGIWDGSIEHHPDLGNRLTTMEFEYMSDHGQHVSGTMLGAGIIDSKGRGMAPEAKVLGWNFNIQQNGLSAQQEMLQSVRDYKMSITQNSYGVGMKEALCLGLPTYDGGAYQLDVLVNSFPTLSHVFSVGNDQYKCLPYTNSRYSTSTKRAKNPIFVGAVNQNGGITDFSSWGPTDDGRLIPHISAFGEGVYSTTYNNTYQGGPVWSGTSMATPVVSGVMTLVYERYKQLYGEEPIASLAKGAMLNTATDRGSLGPDYQYGYGLLDGEKTVSILEKKQFFIDELTQAEQKKHTIQVPSGVKELRVMLVWSDKAGVANNKSLINDLDLTISHGGTTYLPWVLDPVNPSQVAKRGEDHRNNQEQVTIKNPIQGTCTVNVSGFEIPSEVQQYSLVYYFVKEELKVVYPNGGEKLNPGDEAVFMWTTNGYTGDQSLEISFDGGKTYQLIADHIPASENTYTYMVPENISENVFIRVVQEGTSDRSDEGFHIMNTPKNLAVENKDDCGTVTTLTWDAVPNATKYKVLKANVAEGTYSEIAEVTTNSYDVTGLSAERNILSVSAVSADGAESERAYAVIVEKANPVDLAQVELPFEENFQTFPSNYLKVVKGKGVDVKYTPTLFEYSSAHLLQMKGNENTSSWNESGNLFEANPNDVASVKICDLNAINHQGKLWLRVAGLMGSVNNNTAKMRVRVGDKVIENTKGVTELTEISKGQNIIYWDLTDHVVGKNTSLAIESVLSSSLDSVSVGHIKIFKPVNDLAISFKAPKRSRDLTNAEIIEVKVRNYSGEAVANIPVTYQINDGVVVEEFITETIEPMQSVVYQFKAKADLSAEDVLFNVKTKVVFDGDEKKENDVAEDSTVRYGNYHLMPTTTYGNRIIAQETPKGFTDPDGKVLNYANSIKGNVVIQPESKGKKAKLKFLEFALEDGYDKIIIRDGYLSSSPIIAELTGENLTLPLEFVSTDDSGNLYVQFISDSDENKAGWYAEISETIDPSLDESNVFSIEYLNNYKGDYTSPSTISVTLNNNSSQEQKNIEVRYRIDEASWVTEIIPSMDAKSQKTYDFVKKVTIPAGTIFTVDVEIVNEDTHMKDNKTSRKIENDFYCFSYSNLDVVNKNSFFIVEVSKDGVSNFSSEDNSESAYPQYFREVKFPVYKDVATQSLKVVLAGAVEGGKIGVWVDWNNNKDYSDDTPYVINTVAGQTDYNIPISISSNTVLGTYFTRVRLTSSNILDPCASEYAIVGEVEDYMIEVFDNYPITKDVALIATTLTDGVNLSNTESLAVTIENKSAKTISGFEITYQIDGNAVVKEVVSQTIPAFGTLEYVFEKSADLSVSKYYEVKFEAILPEDQNAGDNVLKTKILNQVPAADGYYALDFDGKDDLVDLGTLDNTNLQSFTYEAWINPESYGGYAGTMGFGRVFEGKAGLVFLHGEGNSNYPEHSLIVSSLGGGTYYTDAGAINLGIWQHIAVTFDHVSKSLKIYIDGEEVNVNVKRDAGVIEDNSTKNLYIGNRSDLNRAFDGMIDNVRIWKTARSGSEVAVNMHNSLLGVTDLVAEFKFNEGHFNKTVTSGSLLGKVLNADYSDGLKSIWKEPKINFVSYKVEDQVIDFEEVTENHIKSEIKQTANIASIIATFNLNMKNTEVKVNSVNQISGVTPNDFTDSKTTPVVYQLLTNHLGKKLTKTLKVELTKEKSNISELLTFEIPSVNVQASSITEEMIFQIEENTDIKALIPEFTISVGAKAYVNGAEIVSGVTQFDFTKPVVIKVLAENKRDYKLYSIKLQKSQVISWTQEVTKTYGDAIFDLTATSTSSEDIIYTSSNPEIISIAYNRATIKGVGSVKITATQLATNVYNEAESVSKVFTVDKALLTATADDKSIEFSDAIPELTVTYSGFVYGEDQSVITPPEISTSATQGSSAGVYPIKLTAGKANNYQLSLVNGLLTIIDVDVYKLTFRLKQEGLAVSGASININGTTLISNTEGVAEVILKAGVFDYTITKQGKEDVIGSVDLSVDKIIDIEIIDTLPFLDIFYTTDGNGIVVGKAKQSIKKGKDGEEVTAVANDGYIFDKWSDGITTPKRTEIKVQSEQTYEAFFKAKPYSLVYSAGENGTLKGELSQTIYYNENGTSITAIADEGYAFYGWSDGVFDNPRIETSVTKDIAVTALFEKVYSLPYEQGFENPVDWKSLSDNKNDEVWEFFEPKTKEDLVLVNSEGVYAIIDSDKYGSKGDQKTDLITPMFDLTDYKNVKLSFIHYLKQYSTFEKAVLSYSIDGGVNWIEVQSFTTNENSTEFSQLISEVEGQSKVRFKWHYEAVYGYWWIVDNVKIEGDKKTLTIDDIVETSNEVNVYPNPVDSDINIHNAIGVKEVYLYSLTGQFLNKEVFDKQSIIKIDGSGLSTGVYVLKLVMINGNEKEIKLIKN